MSPCPGVRMLAGLQHHLRRARNGLRRQLQCGVSRGRPIFHAAIAERLDEQIHIGRAGAGRSSRHPVVFPAHRAPARPRRKCGAPWRDAFSPACRPSAIAGSARANQSRRVRHRAHARHFRLEMRLSRPVATPAAMEISVWPPPITFAQRPQRRQQFAADGQNHNQASRTASAPSSAATTPSDCATLIDAPRPHRTR